LVIAANHLKHKEKEVKSQITDAVTTPVFTNEVTEVLDAEEVKEKKELESEEEMSIFVDALEQKQFYQEIPNHGYRRGISV
jgi:ATP-dependent protease HslVU (ClpYQ) ATPase subunit